MITLLLWVAGGVFPSATTSSWMSPAAFQLQLGDERAAVEARFRERGWRLEEGKAYGELVHEYDEGRTVSLTFADDLLVSARFELASFPPESRDAFKELRGRLARSYGEGRVLADDLIVFSRGEVLVHLVLLDRLDGDTGAEIPIQLVVARYFLAN